MKTDNIIFGAGAAGILAIVALIAATAWGYVANIISIVHTIDLGFTALLACRLVGVLVAPLGAILGLFV